MRRRAAAALLILALAGCGLTPPPEATYAGGWPRVAEARAVHAVRYPAGLSVLAGSERAALDAFLTGAGVRPGDGVTLLAPDGADSLDLRRRETLADLLAARGLRTVVTADPEPGPGLIRVAVDRTAGLTPGCPDWTGSPLTGWRNATSAGFGCASAANLAQMLARPADLARGDDPGPGRAPDAVRRATTSNTSPAAAGGVQAPGGGGSSAPSGGR